MHIAWCRPVAAAAVADGDTAVVRRVPGDLLRVAVRQHARVPRRASTSTTAQRHERLHSEPGRQRHLHHGRQHPVQRGASRDRCRVDARTGDVCGRQPGADHFRLRVHVHDDRHRRRPLRRHPAPAAAAHVGRRRTGGRRRHVAGRRSHVAAVCRLRSGQSLP